MSAQAARPCCAQNPAIAASFAPTAPCPVRRSKNPAPAVAHIELTPDERVFRATLGSDSVRADFAGPRKIHREDGSAMRNLLTALSLAFCLAATAASPQPAPPNDMGVTNGHWHMNSKDIEANKKIFVTLGGTYQKNGNFDIVKFPGVIVFLNQGTGTPPTAGRSDGTVVNHGGLLAPEVQQ